MRAKALYVMAPIAVLGIALALMLGRAPPPAEHTPASPPAPEVEVPASPPPEGFAETYASQREEALMREAQEAALESARADERERWENLKREQLLASQRFLPSAQAQLTEQSAQKFESEQVDRDWAPAAQGEILEKISQTGVKALDVRVECKTTICRLELVERATDRPISIPVALALLQTANLRPLPAREIEGPAGARTTVSYIERR